MEIGPVDNNKPVRPDGAPDNRKAESALVEEGIVDKVEISRTARARLAELADQKLRAEREKIGPVPADDQDRVKQIRNRIRSGYYDRPEVRSQIVEKLIDDLDD